MDQFGYFLVLIPIVGLVLLSILWHFSRSSSILQQWADRNGYRIIDQQYRTFFKGPFFWTSTKGQVVYYVKVEDAKGRCRSGWVRCGGWFLGLLSNHVGVVQPNRVPSIGILFSKPY